MSNLKLESGEYDPVFKTCGMDIVAEWNDEDDRGDVCQLEMTQQEYDQVSQCESVVVREYKRPDGSRFAKAVAWGDAQEMEDQASTAGMYIVPVGLSIICQRAVPVSELLA